MDSLINKIRNLIVNNIKILTDKIDSDLIIGDISKLKGDTFTQTFTITGKGIVKSLTIMLGNTLTDTVSIVADDRKTTLRVGENGLYQNTTVYSKVLTIKEPIPFNSKFSLKGTNSNLQGNIIYLLKD